MADEPRFKSAVENILSYLLASEPAVMRSRPAVFQVPIGYFSAVEPMVDSLIETLPDHEAMFCSNPFSMEPKLSELVMKDLDVGLIVNANGVKDCRFAVERVRVVPPTALRGKVKGSAAINVEHTSAFIYKDLTYEATRSYLGKAGNGFRHFEYNDARIERLSNEANRQEETACRMAVSVALARRFMWHVQLGYIGVPSINLMTDSTGVGEILKARDVSVRKGKREAILHWVASHWRRYRRDPDRLTRVKDHLRGKTSFEWDGLHCTVIPSIEDVLSCKSGGGPVTPFWRTEP